MAALAIDTRRRCPMFYSLFGEADVAVSPWWIVPIGSAFTTLGVILKWAWGEHKKLKAEETRKKEAQENTLLAHYKELCSKLENTNEELLGKLQAQIEGCSQEKVENERCKGHIGYLEGFLESRGITDYRRFTTANNNPH